MEEFIYCQICFEKYDETSHAPLLLNKCKHAFFPIFFLPLSRTIPSPFYNTLIGS